MKTLTPLLSDSIRDILKSVFEKHSLQITKDLLDADGLINLYNKILNMWGFIDSDRESICNILIEKINALVTDEVRALSIRRDVFEISFTPKDKPLVYTESGNWSRENRQTGKPGRIIKKLLVYDYKERDIEIFSNQFKAELMDSGEFKIVSGSNICHWYDGDNYYKIAGTLGNSCMRYCECQDYFEVYKDCAKMLICTKNDKLLGRAILWEIDGQTYMDRIYVCMDYLEEQFIQYAMDHKWYVRVNQSLLSDYENQNWLDPESNYKKSVCPQLVIKLPECYNVFPYMDSFRHFDPDKCTISTIANYGKIKLSNTDGRWDDDYIEIECGSCGNTTSYSEDDDPPYHWSEFLDQYLCDDCAVYNEYIQDYISRYTETYEVSYRDDLEKEIPAEIVDSAMISEPNFQTNWPEEYFIRINDNIWNFSAVKWDILEECYKLKDEND